MSPDELIQHAATSPDPSALGYAAAGILAGRNEQHAELRRLAQQLVDAAETIRQEWAQADQDARGWMRDLLHNAADQLRQHLDATDPEGPTT